MAVIRPNGRGARNPVQGIDQHGSHGSLPEPQSIRLTREGRFTTEFSTRPESGREAESKEPFDRMPGIVEDAAFAVDRRDIPVPPGKLDLRSIRVEYGQEPRPIPDRRHNHVGAFQNSMRVVAGVLVDPMQQESRFRPADPRPPDARMRSSRDSVRKPASL